jgi:RNA polymerase sigma factor (sigma-70 family)
MAYNPEEFRTLMARVLDGSEEAADQLVKEYGPYLKHAVRRRLDKRLRSKFDSEDFEQDVWKSFFAALPRHETFDGPELLAGFLATLARNKVVDAVRQRTEGQKWNVTREQPLPGTVVTGIPDVLARRQATPSTMAMSREEWDRLLGQQQPVHRRVLMLFREGRTAAEIAHDVEVSERTVQRIINKCLPGYSS